MIISPSLEGHHQYRRRPFIPVVKSPREYWGRPEPRKNLPPGWALGQKKRLRLEHGVDFVGRSPRTCFRSQVRLLLPCHLQEGEAISNLRMSHVQDAKRAETQSTL